MSGDWIAQAIIPTNISSLHGYKELWIYYEESGLCTCLKPKYNHGVLTEITADQGHGGAWTYYYFFNSIKIVGVGSSVPPL